MSIRIRPFVAEDSQAYVDIYNQARPIEVGHLSEERFWSWFADAALDPTRDIWIACDDDGPLGHVTAFPWPGHLAEGYVFFIGPSVLPEFRQHGVGRQLLSAMLEDLARRYPGKRVQTRLAQANIGADEFLTQHMGFAVERQFWRMSHAAPGQVPEAPVPAGFSFEYLLPGADPREALAAYGRILDDPLTSQHVLTEDQLRGWAGLETFTAHSFCLAKRDGEVVGVCYQSFPRGSERSYIQFLGVVPACRGQGVAVHLLRLALRNAHEAGRSQVDLEVSGDSELAQALYKRMGFALEGGEVFYVRSLGEPVGSR